MVFKPSFKYLKNEKDNFIKVIPKLEYLFYQNIYIYIYLFHLFLYLFTHLDTKNSKIVLKEKKTK